jgi:hypothetical protein
VSAQTRMARVRQSFTRSARRDAEAAEAGIQGVRLLHPIKESDPFHPRRRDRLDADPKVFGVAGGEGPCAGAECATRNAVLRALRGLRVKCSCRAAPAHGAVPHTTKELSARTIAIPRLAPLARNDADAIVRNLRANSVGVVRLNARLAASPAGR